jgi:hypothetical protein
MEIGHLARPSIYFERKENSPFCYCVLHYGQLPGGSRRDHLLLDGPVNFRTKILRIAPLTHCATAEQNIATLCAEACFTSAGFLGAMYFLPFFKFVAGLVGRRGALLCSPLVFP